MGKFKICLPEKTDVEEFVKSLSFVSENIEGFELNGSELTITVSDDSDVDGLKSSLEKAMLKYKKNTVAEVYYENSVDMEFNDFWVDDEVINFGNGQIGFNEKGKFLLEYFDLLFSRIAFDMGAVEKHYPVLLPIREYALTGYIKKSPQYAIFCSPVADSLDTMEQADKAIEASKVGKLMKEPTYALSPSACFHTYIEYRNKVLEKETIVTFKQNVFRNEGRLNYDEIGRLMDYQVREIVMIGDDNYVVRIRDAIMEKSAELMKALGLKGDITLASDSFIMPKMQLYKKIQRIDKSKYEMHLYVSDKKVISTASFNLHGKAFTDPFNIGLRGCNDTVTACVGFGLQRWVIAFVTQHGWNEEAWPEEVRNQYSLYKSQRKS